MRRAAALVALSLDVPSLLVPLLVLPTASSLIAPSASAQVARPSQPPPSSPNRVAPLVRLDFLIARYTAVQVGGGAEFMLDPNVRLDLTAALGSSWARETAGFSGRADAVARFVVDPDGTRSWSLYGAGGAGARYDVGDGWRAVLIVLVGVEFVDRGKTKPFVEAGFSGGLRLGGGIRF